MVIILLISALSGCIGGGQEEDYKFHGMEYNPASPAPDFTLTDQNGHNVSLSDYAGKVIVLAFTYTSCPDVCLAIEANLHYINGEMSDEDDLVILSMTIDPARDSPEHLLEWTTQRGYDWTHLTNENHSQISQVWTSYNLFVDTSHLNSDHSDHSDNSNMSHQVSVLYPDNTTALLDGEHGMLPEENATGWDLTESTLSVHNISLNYSVHETYGHSVNGINDVDSPSDWSWYWALHIWNTSSETWEESTTGIDEVMIMQDTDHIAWAASNANLSYLPTPGSDMVCYDIETHTVTNHTQQIDCQDIGYMWAENQESPGEDDSHGHDEMNDEEEMYEVGHNTLTYIIDKDGKKRLIYTGDDWATADFMEDLTQLLHHDTGAEVDNDEQSEQGH
ncbi:MAG: SCO family protein [Candidatus Poseidoniales archaeon]|nr:SCO family protein [Candidatus Poseidoniales archaeon]